MWVFAAAHAQELPALAAAEGYPAALARVDAIVAATKPKKLAAALAAAGLDRVTMPVRAFRGAEIVLGEASPAAGCRLEGDLTCRFEIAGDAAPGEHEVVCHSPLGADLPVAATVVGHADGRTTFEVSGLRACWPLGTELLVVPVSARDLEGVGQGNDLVPPELAGLTKARVEATIGERRTAFQHCLATRGEPGLTGKLVVAYRIAPDGAMASAEVESNTVPSDPVVACVLERFRQLVFPPVNDGYDHGTWPVVFQ